MAVLLLHPLSSHSACSLPGNFKNHTHILSIATLFSSVFNSCSNAFINYTSTLFVSVSQFSITFYNCQNIWFFNLICSIFWFRVPCLLVTFAMNCNKFCWFCMKVSVFRFAYMFLSIDHQFYKLNTLFPLI